MHHADCEDHRKLSVAVGQTAAVVRRVPHKKVPSRRQFDALGRYVGAVGFAKRALKCRMISIESTTQIQNIEVFEIGEILLGQTQDVRASRQYKSRALVLRIQRLD